MKIGQKVLLIGILDAGGWGNVSAPPIGSIGEISTEIDQYNEYDVYFEGYPHPAIDDPDWVVYYRYLIPIDNEKEDEEKKEELYA